MGATLRFDPQQMRPVLSFATSFVRQVTPDPLKAALGRGNPYQPYHDEWRAIFIHVPKTGGTSILRTLFADRGLHRPALSYRYHDPKRYASYFVFGFARNPFDRLVSAYEQLRASDQPAHVRGLSLIINSDCPFSDFVRKLDRHRWLLHWEHLRPIHHFLCEDENVIVDYVGRYENIDHDFAAICNRIGVKNIELPRMNASYRKPDYREYYNSITKKVVSLLYSKDLEIFDYYF